MGIEFPGGSRYYTSHFKINSFHPLLGSGSTWLAENNSLNLVDTDRPLKCWGPKADGGGHCRDGPRAAVILEFSASRTGFLPHPSVAAVAEISNDRSKKGHNEKIGQYWQHLDIFSPKALNSSTMT